MPSPHTSASNTGASLSNVLLARVNQDVIFSSLGGVLLSLNPGRSVPYTTLSSTSNSVGASSSSSFSSAPLQTEGVEGDREEGEDQDEDEDNFKEISASKTSASVRKSSAALSRLAAITKANSHSPPKTKATRGKGSNTPSGITGVVPIFHPSVMWVYYDAALRHRQRIALSLGGGKESGNHPSFMTIASSLSAGGDAGVGGASSGFTHTGAKAQKSLLETSLHPAHLFATAAAAHRDASFPTRSSQSIVILGETGSGKSESHKQVLRYMCTVSRSVRLQAQINSRRAAAAAVLESKTATTERDEGLVQTQVPQSARASSSTGAGGGKVDVPDIASVAYAAPGSTTYALETLLADAQIVLEAFGSAGDGFGRSPMSSRYIKWTRLQVAPDGSIEGAGVNTTLIDHWRVHSPPPRSYNFEHRLTASQVLRARAREHGEKMAQSAALAKKEREAMLTSASQKYLQGVEKPLNVDDDDEEDDEELVAAFEGGPLQFSSETSTVKAMRSAAAAAKNGSKLDDAEEAEVGKTKQPYSVETNFRVFYLLLAGLGGKGNNNSESSSLKLFPNPKDYAFLAAYGQVACPSLHEDYKLSSTSSSSSSSSASAAFLGAAKAYVTSSGIPSSIIDAKDVNSIFPRTFAFSTSASRPKDAPPPLRLGLSRTNPEAHGDVSGLETHTTKGAVRDPFVETPLFLRPDILSNEFLSLREALNRLQLSAGAQMSIFKLLSAILLLGNIVFESKSSAGGLSERSPLPQNVTSIANGEDLWTCATLLGVEVHALAHALTHVASAPSLNPEKKTASAPSFTMVTPSRASIIRDALAAFLYRRLWDLLVQHINSVMQEAGALTRIANIDAGRPPIGGANVFIDIIDGPGLSGVSGVPKAHPSTQTTTTSHSRRNTSQSTISFAQMLMNFSAEVLEQVYSDSVLASTVSAYEREGVQHPYIEALPKLDSPEAAAAYAVLQNKGAAARSVSVEAEIEGTISIPCLPLPENAQTLRLFDEASAATDQIAASALTISPGSASAAAAAAVAASSTSIGRQLGLFSLLNEATSYAFHDISNGLAQGSASTFPTMATVARHPDVDLVNTLTSRLKGSLAPPVAPSVTGTQATPSNSGPDVSIIRRVLPSEVDNLVAAPVVILPPVASTSSTSNTVKREDSSSSSGVAVSVASANVAAASLLFAIKHSHGETIYSAAGMITENAAGSSDKRAGGVPPHALSILASLSSETLVKILLTEPGSTPSDEHGDTSALLESSGKKSSGIFPEQAYVNSQSFSSTSEGILAFTLALRDTLEERPSQIKWIRCIRPHDSPLAPPHGLSHDAVERQLSTIGATQHSLVAAFGHPYRLPVSEFYERYSVLDRDVLSRHGPFFPTAGAASAPPMSVKSKLPILTRARVARLVSNDSRAAVAGRARPPHLVPRSGQTSCIELADALWAKLYLPLSAAEAAKRERNGGPRAKEKNEQYLLHAPLESVILSVLKANDTASAATASASVASSALHSLNKQIAHAAKLGVPFRFSDESQTLAGKAVAANNRALVDAEATLFQTSLSGQGALKQTAVSVGQRYVFMSRAYSQVIEAARTRAALGFNAAATKIQLRVRAYLCENRYRKLRNALVSIQSHFRGKRHRHAYIYYREKALTIKSAVRSVSRRKRYATLKKGMIQLQQLFRRNRTKSKLKSFHSATCALHVLVSGFVIRSSVSKWHRAAIRVQLPMRRWLQRCRIVNVKKLLAQRLSGVWRGKKSRKRHWVEYKKVRGLQLAHIRRRFIRRSIAMRITRQTRASYLYLRSTVFILQRWWRRTKNRLIFRKAVWAVRKVQASLRGKRGRSRAVQLRALRESLIENSELQALRLAETQTLGALEALAASLSSAVAVISAKPQLLLASSSTKGSGATKAIKGATTTSSADLVVVPPPIPQDADSTSSDQQLQQIARPATSGGGSGSCRLLDIDVVAPIREIYYVESEVADENQDAEEKKADEEDEAESQRRKRNPIFAGDTKSILVDRATSLLKWSSTRRTIHGVSVPQTSWAASFGEFVAISSATSSSSSSSSASSSTVTTAQASRAAVDAGIGRSRPSTATTSSSSTSKPESQPSPSSSGFVSLAIGDAHTIAVSADGRCYSWGWGDHGQLGRGNTSSSTVPTLIDSLSNVNHPAHPVAKSLLSLFPSTTNTAPKAASTATDEATSTSLERGGRSRSGSGSGSGSKQLLAGLAPAIRIDIVAAGRDHTLSLSRDGLVFGWGGNGRGQLGQGHRDNVTSPMPIVIGSVASTAPRKVSLIACGDRHSVLLSQAGAVYVFGAGESCGSPSATSTTTISMNVSKPSIADDANHHNDESGAQAPSSSSKDSSTQRFTDILRPSPVRTLTAVAMVDVACGRAHTIVIAASGEVYSWGSNEFGQCGIENSSTAVINSSIGYLVSLPTRIKVTLSESIASSDLEREAVKSKKTSSSPKGSGSSTPLGSVSSTGASTASQSSLSKLIPPSGRISAAAKSAGVASTASTPTAVSSERPLRFVKAACGARHTLLLTSSDRVVSFGRNNLGQLGLGGRQDRFIPAMVPLPLSLMSNSAPQLTDRTSSILNWSSTHSIAASGDCSFAVISPIPPPSLKPGSAAPAVPPPSSVVQWGRCGAVTEARWRVWAPAVTEQQHAINQALSTSTTIPPMLKNLVAVPTTIAPWSGPIGDGTETSSPSLSELLLPTPVKSIMHAGGALLGQSQADAVAAKAASSGKVADTPVGVFASGNTTLTVSYVYARH